MQFDIDMKILKAAYLATSKEATRYYLNGVAIEWNGKFLTATATDGHRLVTFNLPHDADKFADVEKFSVIIPNDIIKSWKLDKNVTVAQFTYVKGEPQDHCSLTIFGTSVTFAPLDGTFPDWRRIIPAEVSGAVAQFNATYLKDFAAMTKILDGREHLIGVQHNGDGPAVIDLKTESVEVVAVLMPVRSTPAEDYVKPAFCL